MVFFHFLLIYLCECSLSGSGILCRLLMTNNENDALVLVDNAFGKLPDHLLIEIFIRVPISEWAQISCVKKQWANLFRGECLWQAALNRNYPFAGEAKRWPGPIPQGLSRRWVLMTSQHFFFFPALSPLVQLGSAETLNFQGAHTLLWQTYNMGIFLSLNYFKMSTLKVCIWLTKP